MAEKAPCIRLIPKVACAGKPGKKVKDRAILKALGEITDGEYLYTRNISGSRIDHFDFEGNLVNSTSLVNLDLSFITVEGFLSDRDNARRTTYKNSIDLYDANGTLLYSLEQEGQTPDMVPFHI